MPDTCLCFWVSIKRKGWGKIQESRIKRAFWNKPIMWPLLLQYISAYVAKFIIYLYKSSLFGSWELSWFCAVESAVILLCQRAEKWVQFVREPGVLGDGQEQNWEKLRKWSSFDIKSESCSCLWGRIVESFLFIFSFFFWSCFIYICPCPLWRESLVGNRMDFLFWNSTDFCISL